jgi:ribonuclease E
MIEEPDDEVGITRLLLREKLPPLRPRPSRSRWPPIKGVLPDQPAEKVRAPRQDDEAVAPVQPLIDTVPLGNGVDAAPTEAQGAAEGADREGARRRRRRGGRGRNRGEGAGADAQGILDDGSTDPTANGFDDEAQVVSSEAPTAEATEVADEPMSGSTSTSMSRADAEPIQAMAPAAAAPAPASRAAAPAPSQPIVVPQAATRAQPYALPIDSLNAVASAAGLEWVHSDNDKVRTVQAAMAAEPKPPHVPRQPKPPVVLDDGPLVLVETKKDLSQIRLPFDNSAA